MEVGHNQMNKNKKIPWQKSGKKKRKTGLIFFLERKAKPEFRRNGIQTLKCRTMQKGLRAFW